MSIEQEGYLWDNSGVPDPDVEHLQRLLIGYRYSKPLELEVKQKRQWSWRWPVLGFAAAAVAVVVVVCVVLLPHINPALWQPTSGWKVEALSGAPVVANQSVVSAELPVGEMLQTGDTSSALLRIGRIGRLEVSRNSALRLTRSSNGRYGIELLHGTVRATTWAPPFTFTVDTASGSVADMGCAFTMSLNDEGAGMVRVSSGWVAIDGGLRQQLVPGGAAAYLRAGHASGTPFFEDSSREFQDALQQLDFSVQDELARSATLATLLGHARPRDVFTLLRLLRRTSGAEREAIVARAMELQPPPAGTTREGLLAGDETMINRWYNSLGLSNVKRWWVNWKDAF